MTVYFIYILIFHNTLEPYFMLQNIFLLKSSKHILYHQKCLRKTHAASVSIGQDILQEVTFLMHSFVLNCQE